MSAELYGGRKFKVGKDIEIIPMLGYNYNNYLFRFANNNQTVNFDAPTIMTMREYLNSAHRISPKISLRLFDDFQFSVAYHWDVSKNRWKVENGTLINSPKEDFSSFRFSLNYLF